MYYDGLSKQHPAVSFLYFVGAISLGVVIQHPLYLLSGILGSGVYYCLLTGRKAWRFFALLLPLFFVIGLVNPLLNHRGNRVLFTIFSNPYTLEALLHGFATASVFLIMMLWFGCYAKVLTSDKFICLFGGIIPSLSLLLVMVLRMIPSLSRKAGQIASARQCIGKGVVGQTLRHKLSAGVTVLSALTDHALEGSIITGDSMRARGYGCAKPTNFQLYTFRMSHGALLTLMVILLAGILLFGGMDAGYTPTFYAQPITFGYLCYCIYLLLPTTLWIKEAVQWHISIWKM